MKIWEHVVCMYVCLGIMSGRSPFIYIYYYNYCSLAVLPCFTENSHPDSYALYRKKHTGNMNGETYFIFDSTFAQIKGSE